MFFEKNWLYYLKITPWADFWENLINSVKANLNAFASNWIWYWLDIFCYKTKNKIKIEQYIYSNSQEWISFIINFFEKLYNSKVSFSKAINQKLLNFSKFKSNYQIWENRHWVLQIKKMWALWWGDFLSSSSINSWILEDYEMFINENDIIKISFSFTKTNYSVFVKDWLYYKHSKWMNEEEKQSFFKSFNDSQNFFKFRYFISTNFSKNSFEKIIEKNLRLYDSSYNSYIFIKKKNFFNIINSWKRILQWEAILSQWLFLPVSNKNTEIENIKIIKPNSSLIKSWFIEYI